jgi:hypothetical protein
MHKLTPNRTAATALVEQLLINGVEHVFCVPGESFLPVLDALRDSGITVTVCRHEGGAAMMAEAIGKVTGRPGICFVTRGPGATNASAGIHIAQQDSTPMIMFVGQVESSVREREAFQELDYRAVFGSMTKWTVEVDDPHRITEFISRAFYTACSGRPGPVVVALPKDVLCERVSIANAPPFEPVETSPGDEEMARLGELLAEAKNPLFVLGGSRWSEFTNSPSEPGCRSPPAIAARRCSTPCIRSTPAISVSGLIQNWSRAPKPPTCWCWSADVSARSPRRAIRCFPAPRPRPSWSTFIPALRKSAESIGRILRSTLRRTVLSQPSSDWPSQRTRGGARAPI